VWEIAQLQAQRKAAESDSSRCSRQRGEGREDQREGSRNVKGTTERKAEENERRTSAIKPTSKCNNI
jgi:hypothetical protein